MSHAPTSRRPVLLLVLGAAGGLALAALGLLESTPSGGAGPADGALPPDAVAVVNGTPIHRDTYAMHLAGVEAELEEPADPPLRRHVLGRLVDEELLVQRGLELGLAARDRQVRADLVAAVMRSVVVEAEDAEPSREELRRFYEAERALFRQPERLHARQIAVAIAPGEGGVATARVRAREAARRLRAGEPHEEVRRALASASTAPLPDGPLPSRTLREYLGAEAVAALRELAPGAVSEPVRSAGAMRVLVLVAREEAAAPPLEAIEAQVEAEWRRRREEEAVRTYLDRLRERAEVRLAPEAP